MTVVEEGLGFLQEQSGGLDGEAVELGEAVLGVASERIDSVNVAPAPGEVF